MANGTLQHEPGNLSSIPRILCLQGSKTLFLTPWTPALTCEHSHTLCMEFKFLNDKLNKYVRVYPVLGTIQRALFY